MEFHQMKEFLERARKWYPFWKGEDSQIYFQQVESRVLNVLCVLRIVAWEGVVEKGEINRHEGWGSLPLPHDSTRYFYKRSMKCLMGGINQNCSVTFLTHFRTSQKTEKWPGKFPSPIDFPSRKIRSGTVAMAHPLENQYGVSLDKQNNRNSSRSLGMNWRAPADWDSDINGSDAVAT